MALLLLQSKQLLFKIYISVALLLLQSKQLLFKIYIIMLGKCVIFLDSVSSQQKFEVTDQRYSWMDQCYNSMLQLSFI